MHWDLSCCGPAPDRSLGYAQDARSLRDFDVLAQFGHLADLPFESLMTNGPKFIKAYRQKTAAPQKQVES